MDVQQDREWSELSAIWRQEPGGGLDIAKIRKSIRARVRNTNLLFAFDLAVSASAFAAAYVLIGRWTWPSNLVGITFALYGTFGFLLACWVRFAGGPVHAQTRSQALDADARQARARIRWAQSGYMICALAFIVLPILYYAHLQPSYRSLVPLPFWTKVAVVGTYTALLFWRCTRMLRQGRAYLNALSRIRSEIFPDEAADR